MTIEEAIATIPADLHASLDFDGRPRCYLYVINGFTIDSQRQNWISYADADTMPEAIAKAVQFVARFRPGREKMIAERI